MKKPPWNTGLVCPPVTLCYFKQHALKVWHYNQPITLKTCWSRMPAPSKALQTSHDSGTEVPGEGLSQRWSKEPVPVTPKPGAQSGQSTAEPELSHWNPSQRGEREACTGTAATGDKWLKLEPGTLVPPELHQTAPSSSLLLTSLLAAPKLPLCVSLPTGIRGVAVWASPPSLVNALRICRWSWQSFRAEVAQREWQRWQMVMREISSAPRHWKNHLKKQFSITMKLLLLEWKC